MKRLRSLPDEVIIGFLLLWTAVLLQGTLSPITAISEPPFPYFDKVMHFGGWFVLGWIGGLLTTTFSGRATVWLAASVFGFMTELGQIAVPLRSFELWDMVADSIGAAVGAALTLQR